LSRRAPTTPLGKEGKIKHLRTLSHTPSPNNNTNKTTTLLQSYGGGSLFGAFTSTIGTELAKFPQGPSIDSPFWLQLVVFHVGLFVCMTLAQIGIQGRKQGYF
jgi:photosystem I protein PsaO